MRTLDKKLTPQVRHGESTDNLVHLGYFTG